MAHALLLLASTTIPGATKTNTNTKCDKNEKRHNNRIEMRARKRRYTYTTIRQYDTDAELDRRGRTQQAIPRGVMRFQCLPCTSNSCHGQTFALFSSTHVISGDVHVLLHPIFPSAPSGAKFDNACQRQELFGFSFRKTAKPITSAVPYAGPVGVPHFSIYC